MDEKIGREDDMSRKKEGLDGIVIIIKKQASNMDYSSRNKYCLKAVDSRASTESRGHSRIH